MARRVHRAAADDGLRARVCLAERMPTRAPVRDVLAAGAVLIRPGKQVLLVHRPRYDDWSFPKGKVDPGEHVTTCAVREVGEETGLGVRLGPPLGRQRYAVGARTKQVHYWTGRVVGDDDVSDYRPNAEIDGVRWVDLAEAATLLTYERDRETLTEAIAVRKKTHAFVVVRHGKARSRGGWRRDDRRRPLLRAGHDQADRLVPLLAAYGVSYVASSSSVRCVQTVEPYADTTRQAVHEFDELTEEEADDEGVDLVVEEILERRENAVLCGHRPVLPLVWAALGIPEHRLDPGALVVVHHRKGKPVAIEEHRPVAGF